MPSASTVATALISLASSLVAALLLAPAATALDPAATVTAPAQGDDRIGPAEMGSARPTEAATLPNRLAGPTASSAQAGSGPFDVTGERRFPISAHGRIFYTRAGETPEEDGLFSCSGTVVRSAGANLVLTAGHCLVDPSTRKFHQNVIFVPAYRDREEPFGQFAARFLSAPLGWTVQGNTSYDIGVITLWDRAQDQVGGRRIAFDQPIRRISRLTLFGYPAEPSHRYDGERPIGCNSVLRRAFNLGGPPSLMAAPCDMRHGSSGGAWITPAGYLVSVVSHGYCEANQDDCNFLIGPYFGTAAKRLYREAGATERIRMAFRRDPGRVTPIRRPGFRVSVDSSTPVTLDCRLNREPARRCRPAFRLPPLEAGRHVLRVRATDQTGRRAMIGHVFRVVGS